MSQLHLCSDVELSSHTITSYQRRRGRWALISQRDSECPSPSRRALLPGSSGSRSPHSTPLPSLWASRDLEASVLDPHEKNIQVSLQPQPHSQTLVFHLQMPAGCLHPKNHSTGGSRGGRGLGGPCRALAVQEGLQPPHTGTEGQALRPLSPALQPHRREPLAPQLELPLCPSYGSGHCHQSHAGAHPGVVPHSSPRPISARSLPPCRPPSPPKQGPSSLPPSAQAQLNPPSPPM